MTQGNDNASQKKANGNLGDASVERFYSVRQNKSYD